MYKLKPILFLGSLVASLFSGCALIPYNNHFACEGNAEYGKCTNVAGAYHEAITGESAGPKMKKDGSTDANDASDKKVNSDSDVKKISTEPDPYLDYKNVMYKKMSDLIAEPVAAPMVKQPTQIRTLILSYSTQSPNKPLFMPRYVYYMMDDYEWVFGDYLSRSTQRRINELYTTE